MTTASNLHSADPLNYYPCDEYTLSKKGEHLMALLNIKIILGIVLLMIGSLAYADGGCPPGMIPINGTVTQGCVPMPVNYDIPHEGFVQPSEHRDLFWGALAIDKKKLLLTHKEMKFIGVSHGHKSMNEAKKAALDMCISDGSNNCEIIDTAMNMCLFIAISPKANKLEYVFDPPQIGADMVMRKCTQKYGDCKMAYSGCN